MLEKVSPAGWNAFLGTQRYERAQAMLSNNK
jgi:hypothetical protein